MRHATLKVILGVLLLGAVLAAGPAPAGASSDACSVHQARDSLRAAHRAALRAEARESEARHVLSATRYYSSHDYTDFAGRYVNPVPVGRWIRLARRAGWGWGPIDTLMHIIARESSGDPSAKNPSSSASGLLQFLSDWWYGKWNPFNALVSLIHGQRAWLELRFGPWAL